MIIINCFSHLIELLRNNGMPPFWSSELLSLSRSLFCRLSSEAPRFVVFLGIISISFCSKGLLCSALSPSPSLVTSRRANSTNTSSRMGNEFWRKTPEKIITNRTKSHQYRTLLQKLHFLIFTKPRTAVSSALSNLFFS